MQVNSHSGKNARKHVYPYICEIVAVTLASNIPGPGTYVPLASISPEGKQFYSKFESSRAAHFNPPCSSRCFDEARNFAYLPGPGQYNHYVSLSLTGDYFLTKYKSSMCRTFGNETRPDVAVKGTLRCITI
jgi:hypothetical protein